jgi:hypothetical protein
MILTPHAIVGATLANIFPDNPALGFSLAFTSHYVLDMLPHVDYKFSNFLDTKTKKLNSIFYDKKLYSNFLSIVIDFLAAVLICVLFFVRSYKSLFITLVGVAGGVLPDFLQFLYYKFNMQPWIFFQKIHTKFHALIKVKNSYFWGIFLEIFIPILILAIYFLIKK